MRYGGLQELPQGASPTSGMEVKGLAEHGEFPRGALAILDAGQPGARRSTLDGINGLLAAGDQIVATIGYDVPAQLSLQAA